MYTHGTRRETCRRGHTFFLCFFSTCTHIYRVNQNKSPTFTSMINTTSTESALSIVVGPIISLVISTPSRWTCLLFTYQKTEIICSLRLYLYKHIYGSNKVDRPTRKRLCFFLIRDSLSQRIGTRIVYRIYFIEIKIILRGDKNTEMLCF